MAKIVTQFDLLISCPGDITEEIKLIKDAVDQFNSTYSDTIGISIRAKHWSKNSYPQSGDKPQSLLNKQFVSDCDAAVALMWTRFGTPTDEYGSGTEEEISLMLESNKQVFMYFCDKPISPSKMNTDEYKQVQSFKNKYGNKGIYCTYTSNDEFQGLFYAHLSQYFLTIKKVEEIKNSKHPSLTIKGIDIHNRISDNATITQFHLYADYDKDGYIKKITELYSEINSIKTAKLDRNPLIVESFSVMPAAKINGELKVVLTEIANKFNIDLSDNFFDVGNLRQSFSGLSGFTSVSGTKEEESKYHLIHKLYDLILEFLNWISVDSVLSKLKCVGLLLANNGTDYDEDVEVSLSIPKSAFVTVETFPELTVEDKEYLITSRGLNNIFTIEPTSEYLAYEASITYRGPVSTSVLPSQPIGLDRLNYDYDDTFSEHLSDAFGYDVYSSAENYVVKMGFDYIKHNTHVAFPSVLLFFEDISEIEYIITSKRCAEKVSGKIMLNNG